MAQVTLRGTWMKTPGGSPPGSVTLSGAVQAVLTQMSGDVVVGSPLLWDYNPDFVGWSAADASSITMGTLYTNKTSGQAPLGIYADASNVTVAGTSSLDSQPLNPYLMLDHRIKATMSDDSPIPFKFEVVDPNTRFLINEYTQQVGQNFACCLHNPGSYKLVHDAKDVNGTTGQVTQAITVTEPTYDRVFFDAINGSNTNDGKDPHGLSLSNAVFTHATRELTHASLASYDHDAATQSPYLSDNSNFIGLSWNGGANSGVFRIESKPNSTTVVLAVSLGANFSDVNSSNGPKQTFEASTDLIDNTAHHFAGGSVYTTNSRIEYSNIDVWFFSYGGQEATIRAGANMTGLIFSDSPGGLNGNFFARGIHFDGNASGGVTVSDALVRLAYGGNSSTHFIQHYNNCRFTNTTSPRVMYWGGSGFEIPCDHWLWNCDLDGRQITTERKAGCVLGRHDGSLAHSIVFGTRTWGKATDGPIFDHHYYISGTGGHRLRRYVDPMLNEGDLSFIFNDNAGPTGSNVASKWTLFANCRFKEAEFAIAGSNTVGTNGDDTGYGWFEETSIILNSFDGPNNLGTARLGGGIGWKDTESSFIGHNLVIQIGVNSADNYPFYQHFENGDSSRHYFESNIVHDSPMMLTINDTAHYQSLNNKIRCTLADSRALRWDSVTNGSDTKHHNNIFWAPEDTNGNIYDNDSTIEDLATFNAHAQCSGNVEQDPGFNNMAGGDYRTVADVKVAVAYFETLLGNTPGVEQVVSLPVGFGVPKAIMIIGSGDEFDGTGYGNCSFSVGYSDGTNHICCYSMYDAEITPGQKCITTMQQYVLIRTQTQNSNGTRFAITSSFETDQVRLTYDHHNDLTQGFPCGLIAFTGDDIANVVVGLHNDMGASATPFDVVTGFAPDIFWGLTNNFDILQTLGVFNNPGGKWNAKADADIGHGVAIRDGSNSQMGIAWHSPDEAGGAALGANTWAFYNDALVAKVTDEATENYSVAVTNFGADRVTLTPSASTGNALLGYMAMRFTGNVNLAIVDTTIPTANDFDVTGVGFTPMAAMGIHFNGITTYNTAENTTFSIAQHFLDGATLYNAMNGGIDNLAQNDSGGHARYGSQLQLMVLPTSAVASNTNLDVDSSGWTFNADGVSFTMTNHPVTTIPGRMLFIGV